MFYIILFILQHLQAQLQYHKSLQSLMGGKIDCGCQPKFENENTLTFISKNLQSYATQSRLMQFDKKTRQKLQKLFVLNQSHVGDKLMGLIRSGKEQQKDKMLNDLDRIHLQEFDQICHTSQSSMILKVQKMEKGSKSSEGWITKVGAKQAEVGQQCIRNLKFMLIINAQCFGNQDQVDPLSPTDLLSKKTYLQLLLQKIEVLIKKFNSDMDVFIICPSSKMTRYVVVPQNWPDLKVQIIPFQSCHPCFSDTYKMTLYGDNILFNDSDGDMLNFLVNQSELREYYQRYDYINFCDLYNYAGSGMADISVVGSLHLDQTKAIAATIKANKEEQSKIRIENNFINPQNIKFSHILVKSKMLQALPQKQTQLHQLLNSRIHRKQLTNSSSTYYFSRLPTDILYKSFTSLFQIGVYIQNRKDYSNYCKLKLGIINQNDEDIIELCPAVLEREQELQKIRLAIKDEDQKIGYPIVVLKNKT